MSAAVARHRSFRANELGAAAVEFALVLPLLLLLVLGGFEFAIAMFVSGTLESAVLAAARYGTTGEGGTGGTARVDRIRAMIIGRTLGLVDGDDADIATYVYPSFAAIRPPEPFTDADGDGRWGPGEPFVDLNGNGTRDAGSGTRGACEVVLYVVTYRTRFASGLLQSVTGGVTHHASVAKRNEPFGSAPCP